MKIFGITSKISRLEGISLLPPKKFPLSRVLAVSSFVRVLKKSTSGFIPSRQVSSAISYGIFVPTYFFVGTTFTSSLNNSFIFSGVALFSSSSVFRRRIPQLGAVSLIWGKRKFLLAATVPVGFFLPFLGWMSLIAEMCWKSRSSLPKFSNCLKVSSLGRRFSEQ